MPMGMVASSDHKIGKVKSATSPSTTKVVQKTLRCIFLFYRAQWHYRARKANCFDENYVPSAKQCRHFCTQRTRRGRRHREEMESGEAGGLKLGLFKTNRENRQAMRGAAWFGHASRQVLRRFKRGLQQQNQDCPG